MADADNAVRIVCAVQDSATKTYLALRDMKTPQATFEEKQSTVNIRIDLAIRGHHCAQSHEEKEKCREAILLHSAELHELRQDHQATIDAQTKDFEHQRRLVIENFCRLLVQAVGQDLFQKALRDLTNQPSDAVSSTPKPANQPTPPATEPESPVEHPVRSPPPASPERPRKRKTDTEPESHRRRKRTVATSTKVSHVWYDELYQNGQADTKYIIVEHPKGAGQWYIIRCQDCPRDFFKDKPIVTAGSHLSSDLHGHQSRDTANVIKNFGILVMDCDEELAEQNNAVARRAYRKQGKRPRPPDDTAAKDSKHGRRGTAGILSPTPGQIYLCYWEKAKKIWPLLLLPTANLEDVGVPETLESLGLLKDLPSCYRQNPTTKTLEWKEGFEDGGGKVAQRQFPVMFFDDGLKFPSQNAVGWLSAHDLEDFDIESASAFDVPHIQAVREYLRARPQIPSKQDVPDKMDLHDDAMSQLEDETYQPTEVDESNSPEPTISEPRGTGVKAGLVPIVKDRETSIEADGNLNGDNLRRKSIDIISISSTPASESREIHPYEAAVPWHSELNRTTAAPYADVKTTTSANMSANNPNQPIQVNTAWEATVEPPRPVHQFSAEPAQTPELRADYLANIAQNGLNQNLGQSNSVPPGTAQQVPSRGDNTPKSATTYSDFSRMCSRGNPANHPTPILPRVEDPRKPFQNQNQNQNQPPQHHAPNTPQVENRPNNSAIPPGRPQPQPQLKTSFVPIQPKVRPEVVREQSTAQSPVPRHIAQNPDPRHAVQNPDPRHTVQSPVPRHITQNPDPRHTVQNSDPRHPVQSPDPRHAGQHPPWSRPGDQGPAPYVNQHGVPEHNRTWPVGNEPPRPQAPYQGFSPPLPSGPTWRSINGIR